MAQGDDRKPVGLPETVRTAAEALNRWDQQNGLARSIADSLDPVSGALAAIKRLEEQQSTIDRLMKPPMGNVEAIARGMRDMSSPAVDTSMIDRSRDIADSIARGKQYDREEQARLVTEPLVEVLGQQQAELAAQREVLQKLAEMTGEFTTVVREQATELTTERDRRTVAEASEASAKKWDSRKNWAIAIGTMLLVLFAAATLYFILFPLKH